jgi:hypothetical protein
VVEGQAENKLPVSLILLYLRLGTAIFLITMKKARIWLDTVIGPMITNLLKGKKK